MRKKSHLLLALYLIKQMELELLNDHKIAFCVGSILPDCIPSFLTRRHSMEATLFLLERELLKIQRAWIRRPKVTASIWGRIGVILHYVADDFTFPHNPFFYGSIWAHCRYEKRLEQKLACYLQTNNCLEQIKRDNRNENREPIQAILQLIRQKHQIYLASATADVSQDCDYIVMVCAGVLQIIRDHLIKTCKL